MTITFSRVEPFFSNSSRARMIALSNCFSVLAVMVVVTCLPVLISFPRNAPFKVYEMDLSFLIFLMTFLPL